MKKKTIFICLGIIIALNILFFCVIGRVSDSLRESLGTQAVHLLYDFYDLNEAEQNMSKLKLIMTDDVFKEFIFDREERLLTTYLKFNGNSSTVILHEVTPYYIIYSLESDSIDEERIFIFMYKVNSEGKINYVREMEGDDFVKVSD